MAGLGLFVVDCFAGEATASVIPSRFIKSSTEIALLPGFFSSVFFAETVLGLAAVTGVVDLLVDCVGFELELTGVVDLLVEVAGGLEVEPTVLVFLAGAITDEELVVLKILAEVGVVVEGLFVEDGVVTAAGFFAVLGVVDFETLELDVFSVLGVDRPLSAGVVLGLGRAAT